MAEKVIRNLNRNLGNGTYAKYPIGTTVDRVQGLPEMLNQIQNNIPNDGSFLNKTGDTMTGNLHLEKFDEDESDYVDTNIFIKQGHIGGDRWEIGEGYMNITFDPSSSQNKEIKFAQYSDTDSETPLQTLTLLDEEGNTIIKGKLTLATTPLLTSSDTLLVKSGSNIVHQIQTSNVSVGYAEKAEKDDAGNVIKQTYGASLQLANRTLQMKDKVGNVLSTIDLPEKYDIVATKIQVLTYTPSNPEEGDIWIQK